MKHLIPLVLALVFFSACNSSTNQETADPLPTTSLEDSLTAALDSIHKVGQINGFGVAIVNEHGLLYTNGIGLADVEQQRAYDSHTLQNIGSVSKTFIGIALLKAQELGILKLDDPVNKYLPFEVQNPTHPDVPITLRHLATHTSTILDTEYYDGKAYVLADDKPDSARIADLNETFNPASANESMLLFLERLLSTKGEWYQSEGFTDRKPGELFEYTNIGATLAAATLEAASGQSFNAFTTEHILKPLKMDASGWSFADIDRSSHSTLYSEPKKALPYYSLITYPDGGMLTSPRDLGVYLSELIKGYHGAGTLLTPESYRELFTGQLTDSHLPGRDTEDDYDDEYNSGIFMGLTPRGYVGHTGGDPGIACYMFFNPKTRVGRLLMINTSVRNEEGVKEFYDAWYTLGDFETKLSAKAKSTQQH